MATIAQLNQAIRQRNDIAARKVTRDSGIGAATRKQQELNAAQARVASLLNGLPDSSEKYAEAVKLNTSAPESSSARRAWQANGYDTVARAAAAIVNGYTKKAKAEAAASSPRWITALTRYNAGMPYDQRLKPMFERLASYYQQGQASPGRLTQQTVLDALRQWAIDEQPGALDKVVKVAALGVAAYLTYGFATAGSAATLTTTGTQGITVLGAETGLSTGLVTADAALTSAATGAVTSAAAGGSAKDGAVRGAVSGAAGTIKLEGVNMNTSAGTSINNFLTDLGQIKNTVQALQGKPAAAAQPVQTPAATIPAQIGGINTGAIALGVALLVIGVVIAKVI